MIPAEQASTHFDLLHIADRVRIAAAAADDDALHSALCELHSGLLTDLHAERDNLRDPSSPAGLAVAGRQRLLDLITELFNEGCGNTQCGCVARVAELDVALRRQARLEALAARARRDVDCGLDRARSDMEPVR